MSQLEWVPHTEVNRDLIMEYLKSIANDKIDLYYELCDYLDAVYFLSRGLSNSKKPKAR